MNRGRPTLRISKFTDRKKEAVYYMVWEIDSKLPKESSPLWQIRLRERINAIGLFFSPSYASNFLRYVRKKESYRKTLIAQLQLLCDGKKNEWV